MAKVALKELRETEIWLKIIMKAQLIKPASKLKPLLQETDELISILYRSIETAKKNAQNDECWLFLAVPGVALAKTGRFPA